MAGREAAVTALLEARDLEVRLGAFRLGPLSLVLASGEYLVLVGPSGVGKTVLAETLLGWFRPAAGEALLDGRPVLSVPAGKRGIAYVPQDLCLLPHLGVKDNLLWGVACHGREPDPELLEALVTVLTLGPILDRSDPSTLSRGEQQRVALGRALLTEPSILILDEPCAALDPHLRRSFQLLLRRLHREHRTTVLHITHDREEAFLLGDRIAVLLDGRLRQNGPPRALYDRPADLAVARFLAPENLWPGAFCDGDCGGATVRLVETSVKLRVERCEDARPGAPVLVGIRPEEVMVLHADRPLRPQVRDNVVSGTVEELLLLDGRVQAALCTADGLRIVTRLPLCAADDLGLTAGSIVRVSLKPRSLYLLPTPPEG